MNAERIINELKLTPLAIEGGHFRELYRSGHGTSIYYLMRHGERSKWHRVKSDEIWYYHAGVSALQLVIYPDGRLEQTVIGPGISEGERPQNLIPGGCWQTAVPLSDCPGQWGLYGAAVFPAFEYEDFTGAEDVEMEEMYPHLRQAIREALNRTRPGAAARY
jgi:hypothetical protein